MVKSWLSISSNETDNALPVKGQDLLSLLNFVSVQDVTKKHMMEKVHVN